jgi:hypothetical protein
MADRPEHEFDPGPASELPAWARSVRLTREQLAAAQRTLEYHVRKLHRHVSGDERRAEGGARSEH